VTKAQEEITSKFYQDSYTRDLGIAAKAAQFHDLQFQGYLYPDVGTWLLCQALGGADTVSGGSDPWTHSFAVSDSGLPVLSFEHSQGGGVAGGVLVERVPDAILDTFALEARAQELVTTDVILKGRQGAVQGAPATVSFEADRPFSFVDGSSAFTGIDAVSTYVSNFKLSIKNNVDAFFGLGSFAPHLKESKREIDIEFDVAVDDATNKLYREVYFNSATGSTATSSLPIYVSSLTLTFDLGGTPDHRIVITMQNFAAMSSKPLYDVNARIFTQSVAAKGVRAGGSTLVAVSARTPDSSSYLAA